MNRQERKKKEILARGLYLGGMKQNKISDALGVSQTTISKWSISGKWRKLRGELYEGVRQ